MPALVAALKRDQGRPLAEHLADFEDSLRDRGMAADRVKRTVARVSAVVQGCRFTVLSDLSAWAVLAFIANLGRSGFPVRACSHYLEAVVQFWQWLIKDGRLTSPPPARRPRG